MTAMGIDLGTTFGWARWGHGCPPPVLFCDLTWGSVKLNKKPKEPVGVRYEQFFVWLSFNLVDVDVVYYEDVKNHAGVLASHMYGGYLAILQTVTANLEIPLVPIGVGTVKKFATGKGNASKDEMIAASMRLGYDPQDDNAADAIHILRCGLAMDKENKN